MMDSELQGMTPNLSKPFKTFQNPSKPFKTFQNLSKPFKTFNLSKPFKTFTPQNLFNPHCPTPIAHLMLLTSRVVAEYRRGLLVSEFSCHTVNRERTNSHTSAKSVRYGDVPPPHA